MLGPGHYRLLVKKLFECGLCVAVLHLSGHGARHKKNDFSFESLLQEGLAAERWLIDRFHKYVVVSGHSQGGILALAHAGKSHNTAAAFPICAIHPQEPEAIQLTRFARFHRYRRQIMSAFAILSSALPNLPAPLPCYLELRKLVQGKSEVIAMGKEHGRFSYPMRMLYSLFAAQVPMRTHCPVWLFNAKNDGLFTQELASITFSKIDAPRKKLIWLENGGHMAPFNPSIAEFISRHIASACAGMKLKIQMGMTQA